MVSEPRSPENASKQVLSYRRAGGRADGVCGPGESPLGVAACAVVALSVLAWLAAVACGLAGVRGDGLAAVAMISLGLCLVGGCPLAIGGLASGGYRRRLAWVGLVANLLWPAAVLVMLWAVLSRIDV